MSDKDEVDENPDGDDDWMSYANTGFGSTDYSLWDDAVEEVENDAQTEWDNASMEFDEIDEIPAAPRPAGIKHLIRLGACDFCLGRLSGKKRFDQSNHCLLYTSPSPRDNR